MNVTIDLFAPTNLDIIEKAAPFSLAAYGEKMIRSCIKFSSTCNSYIFGQANYTNNKGAPNSINLSGIFIDLLVSENYFKPFYLEQLPSRYLTECIQKVMD